MRRKLTTNDKRCVRQCAHVAECSRAACPCIYFATVFPCLVILTSCHSVFVLAVPSPLVWTSQETPAGRKAAHREGKLRMKQEKLQRENACKKVDV